MGVSTDAILFYGYCWDEPRDMPESWEDTVAVRRGAKNPWDSYQWAGGEAMSRWCRENKEALDDWYRAKEAVEKEFGCDIHYHCSGDFSIPYVSVEASRVVALRGYPQQIKMPPEQDTPLWDRQLEKFLSELEIEKPQEAPAWWLVSYWG
jgi:hypothetical protein